MPIDKYGKHHPYTAAGKSAAAAADRGGGGTKRPKKTRARKRMAEMAPTRSRVKKKGRKRQGRRTGGY